MVLVPGEPPVIHPTPIPVDVERLAEVARQGLAPDSPIERRLLLARAVIPLSPVELVGSLAALVSDAT